MDVESNRGDNTPTPDRAGVGALADGKAPDALRTIGEVARALGIRQHVLRYWEEQFPLLRPLKRSGGRRYYRPGDVELVRTIDRLVHHEGYTLRGARQVLDCQAPGSRRSQGRRSTPKPVETAPGGPAATLSPPSEPASDPRPAPEPEPLLSGLRELRDRLAAALAAA
ncbi:MAG TPA: MerR family transcriptional regulator [Novosphingobium sp.]